MNFILFALLFYCFSVINPSYGHIPATRKQYFTDQEDPLMEGSSSNEENYQQYIKPSKKTFDLEYALFNWHDHRQASKDSTQATIPDEIQEEATGEILSVSRIISGDELIAHVKLKENGRTGQVRMKLWGIDAVELDQPFGKEAKEMLRNLMSTRFKYIFINKAKIGKENRDGFYVEIYRQYQPRESDEKSNSDQNTQTLAWRLINIDMVSYAYPDIDFISCDKDINYINTYFPLLSYSSSMPHLSINQLSIHQLKILPYPWDWREMTLSQKSYIWKKVKAHRIYKYRQRSPILPEVLGEMLDPFKNSSRRRSTRKASSRSRTR